MHTRLRDAIVQRLKTQNDPENAFKRGSTARVQPSSFPKGNIRTKDSIVSILTQLLIILSTDNEL